jgi:hypothetical protein
MVVTYAPPRANAYSIAQALVPWPRPTAARPAARRRPPRCPAAARPAAPLPAAPPSAARRIDRKIPLCPSRRVN